MSVDDVPAMGPAGWLGRRVGSGSRWIRTFRGGLLYYSDRISYMTLKQLVAVAFAIHTDARGLANVYRQISLRAAKTVISSWFQTRPVSQPLFQQPTDSFLQLRPAR